MNEIGIKMNPPARQVFLLLYELHQSGIIHGDPRIANVITLSDNALKWIDFRPQDSEVDLYHDLVTLVESVSLRAAKDMKVIQLMRRYGNSPCRENMTDVYNAVKEFMK